MLFCRTNLNFDPPFRDTRKLAEEKSSDAETDVEHEGAGTRRRAANRRVGNVFIENDVMCSSSSSCQRPGGNFPRDAKRSRGR